MTHWVTPTLFRFTLASGHEVNVEALHVESTYAGFEGVPDDEVSSKRVSSKALRIEKTSGERPLLQALPYCDRILDHAGRGQDNCEASNTSQPEFLVKDARSMGLSLTDDLAVDELGRISNEAVDV
jgi:hypothetical protein